MKYITLLMTSLSLCSCFCLSQPDCFIEHRITLEDQNGVSIEEASFTISDENLASNFAWQCPSEDNRCQGSGQVIFYSDGLLTVSLPDGRTAIKVIESQPAESCSCPDGVQAKITFAQTE